MVRATRTKNGELVVYCPGQRQDMQVELPSSTPLFQALFSNLFVLAF